MQSFYNKDGKAIVMGMIKTVQANKEYLSEIDGAIGDGDHGINMSKGFTLCEARLKDKIIGFGESLSVLGDVLFNEIGGSMGPLYGLFFTEMGNSIRGDEIIDANSLNDMLGEGIKALQEIVDAQVGDKTLMDALIPAKESMQKSIDEGEDLITMLAKMKDAAAKGKDGTISMVAKYGRASRLGERSRGVIDPGAASCSLLLASMVDEINKLI